MVDWDSREKYSQIGRRYSPVTGDGVCRDKIETPNIKKAGDTVYLDRAGTLLP